MKLVFLVALAVAVCNGQAVQLDPCDPANHNELNEPHRSTGFVTAYPETPLCDLHLQADWYRFTSRAGGQMPSKCPDRLRCGTVVPVWLNGTHPSVNDGVVMRQACGNFETGGPQTNPCCEHSVSIAVKNCGNFYVYYLRPTPSCPVAYCAGDIPPCPIGKWSKTGFPPCKDAFPIMTNQPTLAGPIITGQSFHFKCTVDFTAQDPDQRFEVVWTFDSKEDPNVLPVTLSDPDRVALLDGAMLKHHMNTNVGCKVRAYYDGNINYAGAHLMSNTYYAGIQTSPARLSVSEKLFEENIQVTSTVPILCDHNVECCLLFKLDVNKASDLSVETMCDYKLCSNHWNPTTRTASVDIPVVANQDMINDGDQQLLLTFEELLPSGGGNYLDVFSGHIPEKVPVEVKDEKTSTCSITGDPHIHGFDYRSYHLFKTGDFVAYEVPSQDFQIHIRTWPCGNGKVTCICGVTVRDKNDVIRVSQCDQPYNGHHTSPTVDIANQLSEGAKVRRSSNGKEIGVLTQSGAEIRLTAAPSSMNFFLTAPGTHRSLSRGLCGTNDGTRSNEFTRPDGTQDPVCAVGDRRCIPVDFEEAWRSAPANSLFEVAPPLIQVNQSIRYCACKDNHHGAPAINCTARGNVATPRTTCTGCRDLTKTLIPAFLQGQGWTKRAAAVFADVDEPDQGYVHKDLPPVDPTMGWPSASGITEHQAEVKCKHALQKSALWSKCQDMDDMGTAMLADCMSDIMFGDTLDFIDQMANTFTAQCQETLKQDPANYITNAKGERVMMPEYVDDICPIGCDEHGHCGAGGQCVCDAGWEGEACHLMAGKGPQLGSIRSGPFCDVNKRPCEKIFLDVTNLDNSDDVICKVQPVDEQGNAVGKASTFPGVPINAFRMSCPLPKTSVSQQQYKVSVSNDGSLFGTDLSLRVFDSRCMLCDVSGCTQTKSACHIGGKCYSNGEKPIGDKTKLCDINNDLNAWTNIIVTTDAPVATDFLPTITGPNADFLMACSIAMTRSVSGDFNITWIVDGVAKSSETLTGGAKEAFISIDKLPTSGQLTCKAEMGGKQSTSGIIDLSNI